MICDVVVTDVTVAVDYVTVVTDVTDVTQIPVANVVGELGGATLCMMRNLEIERITLAAMSLGIARRR